MIRLQITSASEHMQRTSSHNIERNDVDIVMTHPMKSASSAIAFTLSKEHFTSPPVKAAVCTYTMPASCLAIWEYQDDIIGSAHLQSWDIAARIRPSIFTAFNSSARFVALPSFICAFQDAFSSKRQCAFTLATSPQAGNDLVDCSKQCFATQCSHLQSSFRRPCSKIK